MSRAACLAALSALVAFVAVAAPPESLVVHRQRSPYATVLVVDEGPMRALRFDSVDGDDQTMIDKRDPTRVPVEYVRLAAAGLAYTSGRARALVVGVGGGAFPMLLRRSIPAMRIDAVDIDPVVVDVARRFFGFAPDDHLRVHVQDGAAFVRAAKARYDLALLDAYSGDGVPAHLATRAFFADVRRVLAPGGVAVLNVALDADEERAIIAAFASVFASCTELRGREPGNVIVIGATGAGPRRELARVVKEDRLPFPLQDDVRASAACRSLGR